MQKSYKKVTNIQIKLYHISYFVPQIMQKQGSQSLSAILCSNTVTFGIAVQFRPIRDGKLTAASSSPSSMPIFGLSGFTFYPRILLLDSWRILEPPPKLDWVISSIYPSDNFLAFDAPHQLTNQQMKSRTFIFFLFYCWKLLSRPTSTLEGLPNVLSEG